MNYLGILATLEKRSHADKADVVVPHHYILGVVTGELENILKD